MAGGTMDPLTALRRRRRRRGRRSMKEHLRAGEKVEVTSEEDGFIGSWYLGKIIRQSKVKGQKDRYLFEYQTLVDEDGTPLREYTHSSNIRPLPPPEETVTVRLFQPNEQVDAFFNDGWWQGMVNKVLDGSRYSVYFETTQEDMEFGQSMLRTHMDWSNGTWVRSQNRESSVIQQGVESTVAPGSFAAVSTDTDMDIQQSLSAVEDTSVIQQNHSEVESTIPTATTTGMDIEPSPCAVEDDLKKKLPKAKGLRSVKGKKHKKSGRGKSKALSSSKSLLIEGLKNKAAPSKEVIGTTVPTEPAELRIVGPENEGAYSRPISGTIVHSKSQNSTSISTELADIVNHVLPEKPDCPPIEEIKGVSPENLSVRNGIIIGQDASMESHEVQHSSTVEWSHILDGENITYAEEVAQVRQLLEKPNNIVPTGPK